MLSAIFRTSARTVIASAIFFAGSLCTTLTTAQTFATSIAALGSTMDPTDDVFTGPDQFGCNYSGKIDAIKAPWLACLNSKTIPGFKNFRNIRPIPTFPGTVSTIGPTGYISASLLFGVDIVHPVTGQVMASYENYGLQSKRAVGCPIGSTLVDDICQRSGFDSSKNDGEEEQCCGNPINQGTGSKFQVEVDIPKFSRHALSLTRYYASTTLLKSPFGKNWRSNFDASIGYYTSSTVNTAVVWRPSSKSYYFNQSGGAWASDSDVNFRLSQVTESGVTSWRLVTPDNQVETYNVSNGKLTSITDRDGYKLTLTYDGAEIGSKLLYVTDNFGRMLQFAYNLDGRVSTVTDPNGGVYQYFYDANGNLASVIYPDSKSRAYVYENAGFPNALTGIVDERGNRFATWGYDAQGRATSSQHAGGVEAVTVAYGANTSTVTEVLGAQRTYSFSNVLGLRKTTAIAGSPCNDARCGDAARTYDANGNVSTRTDFNGNVTTYGYDLARNLETSRVEASGSAVARTISTQWHGTWRVPLKIAQPLKTTTYVYNGDTYNGSVVSCAPAGATVPSPSGSGTVPIGVLCRQIEQATTDTNGSQGVNATASGSPRTWAWTYDQYGKTLSVDGPRTDVSDVTAYSYYAANDPDPGKRGNLASVSNALGHVTQITAYDLNSRPLTIVDPNGVTTSLAYDPRGRLTGKTAGGESTGYQYDGVGQLTKLTLPNGGTLNYTYDAAHRLTEISDGDGNRIRYTLDLMGNRTGEQKLDPNGTLARQITRAYDALSRLQSISGALQ